MASVPGGVLVMALVGVALPARFPHHESRLPRKPISLKRLDFVGVLLLLAAMTLHVTGFEQAANLYEWTSAQVLAPLLVSACLWVAFFASQWYITKPQTIAEPIFPWRFCRSRVVMGIIM
jgi:hypothetical protein